MNETVKTKGAEITKELSSGQSSQLDALMAEAVEKAVRNVLPSLIERTLHEIGYSNVVLGLLQLLAAKSNDSYDDLLRKALTLYGVALDAKDNGNRLAILNPEDEIVREITGIKSSDQTPQPVAR
jgi:hypothetical protein